MKNVSSDDEESQYVAKAFGLLLAYGLTLDLKLTFLTYIKNVGELQSTLTLQLV